MLGNKRDVLPFYLSGTYCHRTGTSCVTPRQPTINVPDFLIFIFFSKNFSLSEPKAPLDLLPTHCARIHFKWLSLVDSGTWQQKLPKSFLSSESNKEKQQQQQQKKSLLLGWIHESIIQLYVIQIPPIFINGKNR